MDLLSLPIGRPVWFLPKTWTFLCFKAILAQLPSTSSREQSKHSVVSQLASVALISGCCQKHWQHYLSPLILKRLFSGAVMGCVASVIWLKTNQFSYSWGTFLVRWWVALASPVNASAPVMGTGQGQEEDSRSRPARPGNEVAWQVNSSDVLSFSLILWPLRRMAKTSQQQKGSYLHFPWNNHYKILQSSRAYITVALGLCTERKWECFGSRIIN